MPASKPGKAEPETIAPQQPQLSKPPLDQPNDRSPVSSNQPVKAESGAIAPQQPQLQPQVAQSVPASNNQAQQEYQRLWQQISQKVRKAYPAYSEQKIVVAVGLLAVSQWDQTKAIRILAQSPAAQARRAQGDAEFYAYLNKVMAEVSAKRKAAQHHKRSRQIDDGR